MRYLHLLLSTIMVLAVTALFALLVYSYNPIFLVFTPFFLLGYLASGWFTATFPNDKKHWEKDPYLASRVHPSIIATFPAYYFVKAVQKVFKK